MRDFSNVENRLSRQHLVAIGITMASVAAATLEAVGWSVGLAVTAAILWCTAPRKAVRLADAAATEIRNGGSKPVDVGWHFMVTWRCASSRPSVTRTEWFAGALGGESFARHVIDYCHAVDVRRHRVFRWNAGGVLVDIPMETRRWDPESNQWLTEFPGDDQEPNSLHPAAAFCCIAAAEAHIHDGYGGWD